MFSCSLTLTRAQAKAHVERLLARRSEGLVQVVQVLRGASVNTATANVKDMIGHMSDTDEDGAGGEETDSALSQRRYILQELVQSLS